jgi:hypothetical protein
MLARGVKKTKNRTGKNKKRTVMAVHELNQFGSVFTA